MFLSLGQKILYALTIGGGISIVTWFSRTEFNSQVVQSTSASNSNLSSHSVNGTIDSRTLPNSIQRALPTNQGRSYQKIICPSEHSNSGQEMCYIEENSAK